ncbi:MAG TPA: hypothetical protein PKD03_01900 [Ignavibacteriaceae bacterium]|nr:hypothetical protein [Ignavibacteriaceae bacterium]
MSRDKRKIGFYALSLTRNDAIVETVELENLIKHIMSLPVTERIYDLVGSNKFHILHSVNTKIKNIYNLIFLSAKYNHRPPLINKTNADERENPKLLNEGEKEKTHLSIKFIRDEVIAILEERQVGISMNQIKNYFIKFLQSYLEANPTTEKFKFDFHIIPKENFLKELNNLKRVTIGNIYLEKNVLKSEFAELADRNGSEIQDDIILTVKAKPKHNSIQVIRGFYTRFTKNPQRIKKIRVIGYSEDGNQVVLDTEVMKKIEYVVIDLDEETRTVNSESLFHKFNEVLIVYKYV